MSYLLGLIKMVHITPNSSITKEGVHRIEKA
jgi:hypothetical protein